MAGKSNKEEANNANKIQAFCVGNSLVLIRNEKVIPIKIADKFIIEAIDELIESGQVCGKDPVVFFGIAVKNTIGVNFVNRSFKIRKEVFHNGNKFVYTYSIHESEYYRKFLEYIKDKMRFEEKREIIRKNTELINKGRKIEGDILHHPKDRERNRNKNKIKY